MAIISDHHPGRARAVAGLALRRPGAHEALHQRPHHQAQHQQRERDAQLDDQLQRQVVRVVEEGRGAMRERRQRPREVEFAPADAAATAAGGSSRRRSSRSRSASCRHRRRAWPRRPPCGMNGRCADSATASAARRPIVDTSAMRVLRATGASRRAPHSDQHERAAVQAGARAAEEHGPHDEGQQQRRPASAGCGPTRPAAPARSPTTRAGSRGGWAGAGCPPRGPGCRTGRSATPSASFGK